MAYLGFQSLDHPPYSPDLAPSDYHLFPELKRTIERSPFFVRREVIAAAEICWCVTTAKCAGVYTTVTAKCAQLQYINSNYNNNKAYVCKIALLFVSFII